MTAKSNTSSNEFRSLTLVAHCSDPEEFEADVFKLTESLGHIRVEESTYYNVLRGELKLRVTYQKQNQSHGELVAYKRIPTSVEGVYLAEGSVTEVQDVGFLNVSWKWILGIMLGIDFSLRRCQISELDRLILFLDIALLISLHYYPL